MTPHSVTGISPNMAMMGREVLLPASLIVQPPEEPVAVATSFAAEFRQNMRNAHASVRSATSRRLMRSWTGPWRIVEFKTTNVVVLKNVKTHEKQTVHVDRLVPCRGRLHDEAEETVVPPPTRPRRSPRRPARLQDYDLSK